MEPAEKIEYKGTTIDIFADQDAEDPRRAFEHLGTMACWHRRYTLGDVQPKCTPAEWRRNLALEADPDLEDTLDYWRSGRGLARLENWYRRHQPQLSTYDQEAAAAADVAALVEKAISKVLDRHFFMLPLYLYDHSGLTMNTSGFSCGWDSGQVGVIYCSKEEASKVGLLTRKRADAALRAEVQEYSWYLEGAVYGWQVGDDSCWGYYGYDHEQSGLLEAARAAVEAQLEERAALEEGRAGQQEWLVRREFVVHANSPEQAAIQARQLEILGAVKGGVFECRTGNTEPFIVDLADVPEGSEQK